MLVRQGATAVDIWNQDRDGRKTPRETMRKAAEEELARRASGVISGHERRDDMRLAVCSCAGVISDEQLADAVASADNRPLPHVLAELGFASETRIAQAIAESMGLAFVDIAGYDIDPNAALLLSTELMRKYTILPIKIQDEDLVVAMADPANIFAIDDLRIVTHRRYARSSPSRVTSCWRSTASRLAVPTSGHGRGPRAGGQRVAGRRRSRDPGQESAVAAS